MGVRPKMNVISLTDAAASRVRDIIANADKPLYGLRVGVTNGGCAGMSYTMDMAEAPAPGDEVVEDKGVRVLVDPKAVLFLLGTQMDFQTSKLSSGWKLRRGANFRPRRWATLPKSTRCST